MEGRNYRRGREWLKMKNEKEQLDYQNISMGDYFEFWTAAFLHRTYIVRKECSWGKRRGSDQFPPSVSKGSALHNYCQLHSCLENPRDGGAWWAAVYGVAQSRTRLKRLSSSSSSSSIAPRSEEGAKEQRFLHSLSRGGGVHAPRIPLTRRSRGRKRVGRESGISVDSPAAEDVEREDPYLAKSGLSSALLSAPPRVPGALPRAPVAT